MCHVGVCVDPSPSCVTLKCVLTPPPQGRDDLRQDAVMQQVFGLVNLLLKRDQEASRRTLLVRTYKVWWCW